ncbi:hypothetical protein F5Y17DRAFT_434444 [Xylariaceae sp. FL0594]|nr:hypothetical protein F5Y17DRAFT_434444 [Xylariaceae sp. FL0594]
MPETCNASEVRRKKPHPFFSNSHAFHKNGDILNPPTPDHSSSPSPDMSDEFALDSGCQFETSEPKRKRRKTRTSADTSEALSKPTRAKRRPRKSTEPSIINHFGHKHTDDEIFEDSKAQVVETPDGQANGTNQPAPSADPVSAPSADHGGARETSQGDGRNGEQKPQKLLKFNPATGTIGSPPRPKPPAPVTVKTGSKRGRKRKTLLVMMSYGSDSDSRQRVGTKIEEIISGKSRFTRAAPAITAPKTPPPSQEVVNEQTTEISTPKKRTPRKTATPKKPSHPFFQAKGKPVSNSTDNEQPETKKRQVIFSSTPCSPKRPPVAPSRFSVPASGSSYSGGMKIPGAQHPAWPWRDMVHIRNSPSPDVNDCTDSEQAITTLRRRKAKGQGVQLADEESLLCKGLSRLGIHELADDIGKMDEEYLRPIASTVRVPTRHFESGRKLQARILGELRTLKNAGAASKTHPAIQGLYNSLPTALSAFDRSTCESAAWAQKYAPSTAGCVLQTGREAELLRDWLQTLKVQAVDTGSSDAVPKGKGAPPSKKRRKSKKLDGFVVSSDEEGDEMDEVTENESDWLAHGGPSGSKRTVVRTGDAADRGKPGGRLTNAVLLSGPHGCGKSATVYAIAKELGFEVFEINAGARRSGKDILERVGDMTRNHQVKHKQNGDGAGDLSAEDTVAQDIKSGKQGMMTSFFQPKQSQPKKVGRPKSKTAGVEATELKPSVPASEEKKGNNREQKQSLILLEEVDILYEEDKQFWSTVISMIAQSKRPFVMTCNNEAVIPLQTLKLHGIFRFSSPPTDLAVDLLLLIAANEGHALGRHAVETLYQSRGHDLRASITELNYWCQMGVGDLRGGFDWFFPRWPKGSDVDGEGQTIRVVSQDTYRAGMGWLNRDLPCATPPSQSTIPGLHQQVWQHWGLDMSDPYEVGDQSGWAQKATDRASSRAEHLALLQSVESFADSMSDSDICGSFFSSWSNHIPLDATHPGLHMSTLDDFTIGNKLLEVTPLHRYDSTSTEVSTSLRLLAQAELLDTTSSAGDEYMRSHLDESGVMKDIERHLEAAAQSEGPITRLDYSLAFDPIAASDKVLASSYLDPSVFDSTMVSICLDVAPFVRSIVAYDQRLQVERRMRSSLISEGGKPEKKRMRTTRAALSALEGSSRATTRREKYFAADINPYLVMRTGGKKWDEVALQYQRVVDGDGDAGAQEIGQDMDVDVEPNQSSDGRSI